MLSIPMKKLQSLLLPLCGALLLGVSPAAGAVDVYQGTARFARALKVEGAVTIGHAYQVANEFAELQTNDPVGEGDKLNLESGARLLLDFTDGSRLSASGPAQFELYRLNPAKPYEIRLYGGRVLLDNRASRAVYLDTRDGALTLNPGGRLLLDDSGEGVQVTALQGETVAGDEDHPLRLHDGERMLLRREQPGAVERADGDAARDFSDWDSGPGDDLRAAPYREDRAERDDEEDNEDAADVRERHVELPADIAIYRGELDRHGSWRFISGYGWTWHPRYIAAGWMPYSMGFWRHTPWGVFWVSSEPWGWAPYHYGSWRYTPGNGWFWIPGSAFGGAWVVFDNDGDWFSWYPAYFFGGYWRPSWHNCVRVHRDHFYNRRPPVVVVNRPYPTGNHPHVDPPSPPFYPGKIQPREGGGPRQQPSPPFYPGKGNPPRQDGGPRQEPSPPFYPGKGKPREDGGPKQNPSPPFYPGGSKGKPREDGGPKQEPSPPFYPGGSKGKPREDGGPRQEPSPPFNPGSGKGKPREDGGPKREPAPPIHHEEHKSPPREGGPGGGSSGHADPPAHQSGGSHDSDQRHDTPRPAQHQKDSSPR